MEQIARLVILAIVGQLVFNISMMCLLNVFVTSFTWTNEEAKTIKRIMVFMVIGLAVVMLLVLV